MNSRLATDAAEAFFFILLFLQFLFIEVVEVKSSLASWS